MGLQPPGAKVKDQSKSNPRVTMKITRIMMKKRILALVAVLFMAVMPAMSQVFVTDEEMWESNRVQNNADQVGVMVPMEDVYMDQWKFAPVGDGVLLLAGLAGAYLFSKRKKDE